MFPGFVTIFKDKDKNIHLYFFPGIDEDDKPFYRDLDLSKCGCTYTEHETFGLGKEFIFENKRICKIVCKLIDNKGNTHLKELFV